MKWAYNNRYIIYIRTDFTEKLFLGTFKMSTFYNNSDSKCFMLVLL